MSKNYNYSGSSSRPLYKTWKQIKQRCNNPNNDSYSRYGGRGIYMWSGYEEDFWLFESDCIKFGWQLGLEIDRIDNNEGYYPDNIRFVTVKDNSRNRRSNKNITYNDKTQCLKAWAEELNVSYITLYARVHLLKWSIEKAFTKSFK